MLITYDGVAHFPDHITPYTLPPPAASTAVGVVELTPAELLAEANEASRAAAVRNALVASAAAAALVALGLTSHGAGRPSRLRGWWGTRWCCGWRPRCTPR